MPRDNNLTDRLTSRLERGELERVTVGGKHAYRGDMATKALDAVGARVQEFIAQIHVNNSDATKAADKIKLFSAVDDTDEGVYKL